MTRYWSINGRFLTQRLTGVQRYAREIVKALDNTLASGDGLADDLSIEMLVPPNGRDDLDLEHIRIRRVGSSSGQIWEQFVLPRHVRGGLISLGNVGPLAIRKQIVCMHDTTARDCPGSYSRLFRVSQRLIQPCLSRLVSRVTTVSVHSADRLADHGICARGRLLVAPNGREHALRWKPTHSAMTRAAAGPDTVVLVGTPAPHKNVRMLLSAAPLLEAAGLRLAIVGSLDSRVFRGSAESLDRPNIWRLGPVSDESLAALLRDSLCLAFPSLFEGFGLPVLEAMTLGCPVVVSDRAGLPDLCGNAALYAAPDRPDQWLGAFQRLRAAPAFRSTMIERGRARAEYYSWAESAQHYIHAMAEADGIHQDVAQAHSRHRSLSDSARAVQPC